MLARLFRVLFPGRSRRRVEMRGSLNLSPGSILYADPWEEIAVETGPRAPDTIVGAAPRATAVDRPPLPSEEKPR